jgi:hypothetical protein
MFHAMSAIRAFWPLTGEAYANLSDEQVLYLDQFILRFTKLQDAMGGRLFPAILQYLNEPFEDRPMLDKLNRLEKLGFINSVEKWQTVRTIRNKFAHDYPEDLDKNAAQMNMALESAMDLHAMLATVAAKLKAAYPELGTEQSAAGVPFRPGRGNDEELRPASSHSENAWRLRIWPKITSLNDRTTFSFKAPSCRQGSPASRLHGCSLAIPSLEPGFRHKSAGSGFHAASPYAAPFGRCACKSAFLPICAFTRRAAGRMACRESMPERRLLISGSYSLPNPKE